ncbi:MAG: formyltransferase family protein [Minisyncoccia bacterium]
MTYQKNNLKIALLISGSGTTMEAIIKACRSGKLTNCEPVLVISSSAEAGGIAKARALKIKDEDILIINPKDFTSREEFGQKIIEECEKRDVNFIGQYGWLWKTPLNVIKKYKDRVINQHPGPLDNGRPDFGGAGMFGMRVHQARLEFVNKTNTDFWTEATAHRVTEKFDEGIVLKNKQVPILPYDTAETLSMRVLPIEHEVQIELLQDFINGTVEEFHRKTPLILPGEEVMLNECKENAKKLYPNG